ncbi:MAG: sensor histidine kinase KdpD [Turneriella sp.]
MPVPADSRPNADLLLSAVNKTEAAKRGKLRIFFGMAAGVGKTCAMLRTAHRMKEDGVDIVVGLVETHGRKETAALIEGLEVLPRARIEYQNVFVEEFDLNAALERKPNTIVVDELPHTNTPTLRHPKRYQDILELLDAGINVMTALNVQHLESVADTVETITNVHVHERVPDSFIDLASEIEVVDLVPEELIKRLEDGKIYARDKATLAANNFFRKGNLTALREMALHFTANFIDQELQDYRTLKNIGDTWKSSERILVAISPSQTGENLIRMARQRAFELKGRWLAVHIDVGKTLLPDAQKILMQNLSLARELGAEVISVQDTDVVSGLLRIARQKNITQIIMGKTPRPWWQKLLRSSMLDRLIALSGDIEIHVSGSAERDGERAGVDFITSLNLTSSRRQYLLAIGATALTTVIGFLLHDVFGYTAISLMYLSVVLTLGIFVGRGPLIVAATISALCWDYFFIPPRYTFYVGKLEDFLTLGIYFVVAMTMGNLMARLRLREQVLTTREERVSAVYSFSRLLSRSTSLDETVQNTIRFISEFFHARVSLNLREKSGKLDLQPAPGSTRKLNSKESSVAFWVFENKKPAGRYTDTLPLANGTYYPMVCTGGIVGVLGVRLPKRQRLRPDQEEILFAFVNHAAITIERDFLASEKRRARVAEESEKLHAAILNSISHELRTPIAVIRGAVSAMQLKSTENNPAAHSALLKEADIAARKLNVLVSNLLDMSRIEAGKIRLNREIHDLRDIIREAVQRLSSELAECRVRVDFQGTNFACSADYTLLEQALINIIANAATHNKPGIEISVLCAEMPDDMLKIIIADNGTGIPVEILDTVFEKFVRSTAAAPGGTGLGLPIAKSIIELHAGSVTAFNRPEGGAVFEVLLPRKVATEEK